MTRWSMCESKKQYDKKTAKTIMNFLRRRSFNKKMHNIRLYQCRYCNYWHMTTKEDWKNNDDNYE